MKLFPIVLIAFFSASTAVAQFINLEFETFDSEKGLSQNHVYSIAQDKKGFIWVGTDDGLNRFDGHDFKVYKHDPDNPNSLIDNSIRTLFADDSSVWIGTNGGLCRYFTETESFRHFPIDRADPTKLHGSQISVIKKHDNGSIWLGYLGDGLDIIMPGKKEISHYSFRKKDQFHLRNDLISSILFMPDGDVMIGTFGGFEILDPAGRVLTEDQRKKKYPWISVVDNAIRCLTLAADDNFLWVGTELKALYRVNLKTGAVRNFNNTNTRSDFNYVLAVHEDSKGNIWIGAEVIYLFDKQQDKPVPYFEYGIQGKMEIVNPIYSIFEDKDKNIWIGTFTIGMLKCNSSNSGIRHFFSNQAQSSIRNEVFCFTQTPDGKIWVGTGETGLFQLRNDLKGFTPAPLNSQFITKSIKCLYLDREGYFWMGAWDAGLMKYHPVRKTLEIFHPDKGNFGSRHAWDITSDSLGNLWIGTLRDGLCYFSPKTGKYHYYKNIPDDPTTLVNDDIMCLLMDKQKRLWVGTGYGLSILLPGSERFLNFQKTNDRNSLSDNLVYCILEDINGRVWVGTNGGGITIFNKDLSIEKIIGENDGLPSNAIASIVADNDHNVWISTFNGLAKINYKDLTVIEVPQLASLRGKEFIPRSSFKSADGKLFFGRYNGFNLLHPDSLNLKLMPEKVVLTSLKIQNEEITPGKLYDNRNILTKSITETQAIHLSYKDQSVTISFAPLTYNWQGSLYYAYMLDDIHTDWQYTTADRRFVHFTNLTPGQYVLKVKASFDGKSWPDEVTSLRISVAPPWWETSWFKALVIALFILILYTAYRVRVRFLRSQKERLELLVEQGTQEIQELLQEVGHKNHELLSINEELKAQRDALEERGRELENAQTKLQGINVSLEELVSKRTKKLNQTLRELETFLYRASHDLRGPISSMLGLIKVVALENNDNPINKTYTEFLHKTTIKLERTLQKLTQKYTIQKSTIEGETITKTLLVSLLEDVSKNIPAFRPNDFELKVDERTKFQTDRAMLNILLINLLENAFFFSERSTNRKVVLDVSQTNNNTVIAVTDHGPGIRHEVKDKIFTMFYRGHELSTGNGLGLYLVKSALQRIKGKIVVETEVGKYSSFIVTLPDIPVNGEAEN